MIEPTERRVRANGLEHALVTWEPPALDARAPTILLCHGFLDQAYGFDPLARRLAEAGLRTVALDFRGHGRSEWVGRGGYYHFPDYVADLDALFPALEAERVHLLGHSMGATVAAMYAGTRPERIASLSLVEGLGPPEPNTSDLPARYRAFLDGVARVTPQREAPRVMASVDEALARMRVLHAELPDALGLFLAEKATREVPGGRAWRFDPLHRTTAPMPFQKALFATFLRAITAPTLVVVGSRGLRLADEDERLACVPGARRVELEGVGHMIHWLAPDRLAALVAAHVLQISPSADPRP